MLPAASGLKRTSIVRLQQLLVRLRVHEAQRTEAEAREVARPRDR